MTGIMAGIISGIVMMFLGIVVLGVVGIRLARQAVIFALLGQLLATAWFFVTIAKGNRALAMGIAARAVHGELYGAGIVQGGNDVWLSDGTRLTVRFCASNSDTNCREDRDHVDRDYWAAYKADRDRRRGVLVPLVMGLVGFPWGLGLWGFYRLIYFAIKGSKPKLN